ncbi:T6SS immunity protein Tli4 family protein [Cupriavidus taiwanensis]|uniref:T6SS immunity protein Tli4 family protein n=1 Tax=Cupriavidus taiwanensis TaxID=164546 RepID=UPI000E2F9709|nr:T6SS immunity protein Tli4 family protein [Cupriavidus taiwanensis]
MAAKLNIAGLFLAALLTTGCQRAATNPFPPMDIHQPSKTHCIGRFLIDLPEEFNSVPDSMDSPGDAELLYGKDKDFKRIYVKVPKQRPVEAEPVILREDFERAVSKRMQELRDARNEVTHAPMLVSSTPLGEGEGGYLIRRYDNAQQGKYFRSEIHLLAGDLRYVIFEEKSYPDSEPAEAVEARLRNLAVHTRAYTDPEAAGPGFCVKGVVLNDIHDEETAMFSFQSELHKDLLFDIHSRALVTQDEGMIARLEKRLEGAPLAYRLAFHTLRKGKRTVAGMEADELVETFKEEGYRRQGLKAETKRDTPQYMQPQMYLTLMTGGQIPGGAYVDSSMDDDEVLKIWDKVVSSIRPRPGAVEGEKR